MIEDVIVALEAEKARKLWRIILGAGSGAGGGGAGCAGGGIVGGRWIVGLAQPTSRSTAMIDASMVFTS
jgi:hypothetical protein